MESPHPWNRRILFDGVPPIRLPTWAEDVYSRATHLFACRGSASSFNISHADVAATLACVARADLFVENQRQLLFSNPESTQSVDMSVVTPSSAPAFGSAHYSSRSASVLWSVMTSAGAFLLPHFAESPCNSSVIPSPIAVPPHLGALTLGNFDHDESSFEESMTRMSPNSLIFSPPVSLSWMTSDDAAVQSLHSAHHESLLKLFRNCWASRIPGRQFLPSEESAVVASFVQNYPLPATCAPDWEVSEFEGLFFRFVHFITSTLPDHLLSFKYCQQRMRVWMTERSRW